MDSKAKKGTQSQKSIDLAGEVGADGDEHAFDEKLRRETHRHANLRL